MSIFGEKTGLKSISEGRSDIHKINPKLLHVKPSWNGRDFANPDNLAHIEQLALSIAEIGVKEPLTVVWEDGKAWLIDGECRLRATLLAMERGAEIKTIPCKVEERYANESDRLFSQIIRNAGKPFSQMEQASVFKRLLDMGWQQQDIAKKAGISASRVSQVLDLLTFPEPIKQMVTNGQVSASMASKVLAEHNPATAVQVLHDAVAVAASEGKVKALPKHVGQELPGIRDLGAECGMPAIKVPGAPKPSKVKNLDIEKTISKAFEDARVDDEFINDEGQCVVAVFFKPEQFELIRQALKL